MLGELNNFKNLVEVFTMIRKKAVKVFEDVVINLGEDKVKKIGKFNKVTKEFKYKLAKDTDFNNKYNGWGLDEKVLNFLVQQGATIHLTDTTLKWEYEVLASDFKYKGQLVEPKWEGARATRYLPFEDWKLVKIKDRSQIFKCRETSCEHNFNKMCLRGVIEINENGECDSFEDRM